MVFARKADDALASLVKQIDKMVADNRDKKLACVVSFLGSDKESLREAVKIFAETHHITNIALVVPSENDNGPKQYKIHADADVTVMINHKLKVKFNHALKSGELNKQTTQTILDDLTKILD